jgi:hypothetical protein
VAERGSNGGGQTAVKRWSMASVSTPHGIRSLIGQWSSVVKRGRQWGRSAAKTAVQTRADMTSRARVHAGVRLRASARRRREPRKRVRALACGGSPAKRACGSARTKVHARARACASACACARGVMFARASITVFTALRPHFRPRFDHLVTARVRARDSAYARARARAVRRPPPGFRHCWSNPLWWSNPAGRENPAWRSNPIWRSNARRISHRARAVESPCDHWW